MQTDFVANISNWQYYRARAKAKDKINGIVIEQYGQLLDYCEEIKMFDLESKVIVKTNLVAYGLPVFKRVYICLAAYKKGFKEDCRPLIGLDDCHING